ncbi:hypothetical protein [Candidatus Fukatsuia anoeciicola]
MKNNVKVFIILDYSIFKILVLYMDNYIYYLILNKLEELYNKIKRYDF